MLLSRLRDLRMPSPFELECRRILKARLAAKTPEEKADAEWAWHYILQMNGAGRIEEYFASRQLEGDTE